ncbi:MAG: LysR family transcriptional regulator [Burkholderiales bacterium]|nr:LysR family transcriptional regulator [Burkholderiales bacterium]
MDWDDVRIFALLAEVGTLSGTAKTLRIEHSTVSRRIDALEQAIGLRLFDRLPRAWLLTTEGERLLEHARQMQASADAFKRTVTDSAPEAGEVYVSAPPSFSSNLLLPRLAPKLAASPELTLVLTGEARAASLTRGEADLAIRLGRPDSEGLVAKRLGGMQFGLFATADYLAAYDEPEHRFIGYDPSLAHVPQQRWLDDYAAGRGTALRSNDLQALYQAACHGLGVAILPYFMRQMDDGLVRLDVDCPVVRDIWLVMHTDVRRSPRVRKMADLITGVIEAAGMFWRRRRSEMVGRVGFINPRCIRFVKLMG